MKNTFLFIFLFLTMFYNSIPAFSQWTKLNSGTTYNLYSIYFTDSATGFCVGGNDITMPSGNGIILRTIDKGITWASVYEDSVTVLRDVITLHNTISAFGVDKYGQNIMARSTDGGNNWVKDTVSFAATDPKYINDELYYIDGNTQMLQHYASGMPQNLVNRSIIFAANKNHDLFALCYSSTPGYNFRFAKRNAGSSTWDTSLVNFNTITTNSLSGSSLWAFGDTVVFLATYPGAIAYSFDRGNTWTDTTTGFWTWDAFVTSPFVMTGATSLKTIVKSMDGGKATMTQDSTIDRAKNLFFLDEQYGFLCGAHGIIYKTTNGGGTLGINNSIKCRNHVTVYPNPFSTAITIEADIAMHQAILTLYNIMGQQVLKAENLNGNTVSLQRQGLAEGIYTYVLSQQGEIISSGAIMAIND